MAIKSQDEQLEKILEYIKKYNNCKTSDIENLLSVKSSRARKLLSILVSEKKIQILLFKNMECNLLSFLRYIP